MGFWIFMLVMDLLLPGVMLWFGSLFLRGVPREINPVFGYRTAMSMKNRDTWAFAHRPLLPTSYHHTDTHRNRAHLN